MKRPFKCLSTIISNYTRRNESQAVIERRIQMAEFRRTTEVAKKEEFMNINSEGLVVTMSGKEVIPEEVKS